MNLKSFQPLLALTALFVAHLSPAQNTNPAPAPTPTPYLSPEDEAKTFSLPPGYRMELVVSDPVIREPVVAVFDGDGKMFIAEMRTYMQDIDGSNEHTKAGLVSLHWSSKRDGVFDQHTVFADKLILPRMILPVGNGGLIINETDSNDLWLFRDKDGDGVSDEKTKIFEGGPRGGNLEHQQSGLIWNLDNWLYMTVNNVRLRMEGTNFLSETIQSGGGQWGLAHDEYGKLWFVNAGGEIGPLNFQQPIQYGRFTVKGELADNYREVWPLIGLADVQGGEIRFRKSDNTLNHLTAACGQEIFRGDRLPKELRGDLFYGEPVGRLVRHSEVEVREGVTYLSKADGQTEFLRSTDPNFRPINMTTAPDGTLYIVDMYRGIIQEGAWVKEGSYLRTVVQQYQLDKNFGRGRIWRLTHDDFKPGPQPQMENEKSPELVKHLDHPNGWWRDTAQKLLVLRGDKSVAPALKTMATKNENHFARIHAIWTLEGLGALEPTLLREKFSDTHPQVRVAAIRSSESLFKKGDASLLGNIERLAKDKDPNVVVQVMLTGNYLKWSNARKLIETAMQGNEARGVREIGTQLLMPASSDGKEFSQSEKALLRRGGGIYNELCFACHGPDGKGMALQGAAAGVTMAPPLGGSETVTGVSDQIINVLLKGVTGPVNGKKYDALMVAMESNNDAWIAAVGSYVRKNFGNDASFISTNDVARVRSLFKERTAPWTREELREVTPQFLPDRTEWKVSASHGSDRAPRAIDGKLDTRYETGTEQVPGMWFQIELPEATSVFGIYLDAASSTRDYPRGYKVEVSNDGNTWSQPVASGTGNARMTEIRFEPVTARFVRITQTGSVKGLFWSIHDLQLLQLPDTEKVKAAAAKKAVTAAFE